MGGSLFSLSREKILCGMGSFKMRIRLLKRLADGPGRGRAGQDRHGAAAQDHLGADLPSDNEVTYSPVGRQTSPFGIGMPASTSSPGSVPVGASLM
jgi:hypothetical protein